MKNTLIAILLAVMVFAATGCKTSKQAIVTPPVKNDLALVAFAEQFKQARQDNRFVIVDFYTDWCKWCKVLDEKTYPDPKVQELLTKHFVFVKYNPENVISYDFNGTKADGQEVAKSFNVTGYPTTCFIDKDGYVVGTFAGFVPPETYVKILTFVTNGGYKKQPLDQYIQGL
jgi:thioredoxin-related protein